MQETWWLQMPEPTFLAKPEDLSTLTRLPQDDPELGLALRRASDRFRGEVGFPVNRVEDDTVELNGDGTRVLLLPALAVDVHFVSVGGRPLGVGEYSVARSAGIIRLREYGHVFPDDLGNVVVGYSHGWDEIPGDIQDAVLEHASTIALVLTHLQQNSAGSVQESYGAAAMVGTTAKWVAAVQRYSVQGRA